MKLLCKVTKGFTLVEVIIVLGIISIISAVAVPSLIELSKNSKQRADIQSCETVKRAINAVIVDEIVEYSTSIDSKIIIDCKDRTIAAPLQ